MAEAEPDPSASSEVTHTQPRLPHQSQDIMEVTEDTAETANSSGMKQSISHTNSLPGLNDYNIDDA